jgi:putative methyltransferase
MQNVYLFQPQYTIIVDGKTNCWLPYSVGALWSFATQFKDITDNFCLKDIIFQRDPIPELVNQLQDPVVCGFSCYLWNRNYCLAAAKAIKQRWPNCVIVFGGPEVSGNMSRHDFIDTLILGEGEENFVDVLRNVHQGKDPSLFMPKNRLDKLDIPSPYLIGVFDDIMARNPNVMWAMTLETNRGCPYACTFCDWGSLTYSKVKKFGLEKIHQEINWIRGRPISYVYLADANFGIFKERDIEIARLLKDATDGSSVDLISVQNAKQSTEMAFEIGKILGNKYAGVAVAMQSMNPDTLDVINRKNLAVSNLKQMMASAERHGIPTYTEMILGLPLETKETWAQGLADLLEAGQHNLIEMWFAQLLENSELNQLNSIQKYGIKSVVSKNYTSLKRDEDNDGIDEEVTLVCATNTMPLEHTVLSYMYGWMIIQLHIAGYTQIVSRYMRERHDVSYKDFYDQLMQTILTDDMLSEHYNKVKHAVDLFCRTGDVPESGTGHMLHTISGSWLYNNKQYIFDTAVRVAKSFGEVPTWVAELQQKFLYDKEYIYPCNIDADFDIFTAEIKTVEYKLAPKFENIDMSDTSLALIRRRGLIKNAITIDEKLHNHK